MKSAKEYITIAEASVLTGKHKDTIRNLARRNSEATIKDNKGRILIDKKIILESYSVKDTNSTKQTAPEATRRPSDTKPDIDSTINNTTAEGLSAKLIDSLVAELEAKNLIISQQQLTIQQIVNQQQSLTAMLVAGNESEKTAELAIKPVNSVSVNHIEEKVIEEKVIEENIKGQKQQKQHWWKFNKN